MKVTIPCPTDKRYFIELDPAEVFTDDPGQGTPEMVYGPDGASGTYACATDTGELTCGDSAATSAAIPQSVLAWLDSDAVTARIDEFWDAVNGNPG